MTLSRCLRLNLVLAAMHCTAGLAEDTSARALAATCTGCHGTSGATTAGIPSLAGLSKEDIVRLMREFREDKRPATIMHQHAKGYTDEQIDAIAAWFAARQR